GSWTVRHRALRLPARACRRPEFIDLHNRPPPRSAWSLLPIHEQQMVASRGSLRPTYYTDLLAAAAMGESLPLAGAVWNRVLGVSDSLESIRCASRTEHTDLFVATADSALYGGAY